MRRSELSELAVVIPSRNRQNFLLRSIKFWSKTNATIYIADGSKSSISNNIISSFNNNIKYYHSRLNLSERISFSKSSNDNNISYLSSSFKSIPILSLKSFIISTYFSYLSNVSFLIKSFSPSVFNTSLVENGKAIEYISKVIEQGYKLYFKPHPESLKRSKLEINNIIREFCNDKRFIFFDDILTVDIILHAKYLITDW